MGYSGRIRSARLDQKNRVFAPQQSHKLSERFPIAMPLSAPVSAN
jgi:hypothetical protein